MNDKGVLRTSPRALCPVVGLAWVWRDPRVDATQSRESAREREKAGEIESRQRERDRGQQIESREQTDADR